ncbi:hypothetical protein QSV08_07695 [Maribacter sp. BPC-D8]|uniref:hypothetical protein n=1 Tax=Maribacter sp. BPC-D8 TaxID=3053613 RepID=UPI002B46F189|nr:hypothetical protein [Maribacter sp. BPC-D8]WRI31127.1 hypothetical protein QSV08_07695 [Maribacter sp. BPC-D8]
MKQTITKNDKSLKILNKLIANGFYNGYVGPEKFELLPNHFPNNHRIIGILNDDEKYDVKFDFIYPMSIAAKVLLGFGVLMTGISILKGDWRILLASVVTGLVIITEFKIKQRKEIKRFTNKFLEFDKAESE